MNQPKPILLASEMATYRKHLVALRQENPNGGYVVIRDDVILGVYRDRVDALQVGISEWSDVPFLVRDLFADEKPINLSRDLSFV